MKFYQLSTIPSAVRKEVMDIQEKNTSKPNNSNWKFWLFVVFIITALTIVQCNKSDSMRDNIL